MKKKKKGLIAAIPLKEDQPTNRDLVTNKDISLFQTRRTIPFCLQPLFLVY